MDLTEECPFLFLKEFPLALVINTINKNGLPQSIKDAQTSK